MALDSRRSSKIPRLACLISHMVGVTLSAPVSWKSMPAAIRSISIILCLRSSECLFSLAEIKFSSLKPVM